MAIITLNAVGCVVILAISLYYDLALSQHYPHEGKEVPPEEVQWIADSTKDIVLSMQKEENEPVITDISRILFVGSSQTWGCGARIPEGIFVRAVEAILNQRSILPEPVRCLNFGVCGQDSHRLLRYYVDSLVKSGYDPVCVNLSHDDRDPRSFVRNLGDFVNVRRAKGIATHFALEAASPERWPGDLPLHHVMREVSSEMNVPLVEMHEYLKERYDEGFIWWDYVHPTSYGHRLIAERLSIAVERELTGSSEVMEQAHCVTVPIAEDDPLHCDFIAQTLFL